MDISINDTAQISWKQIAVQKQERLRTGAEGETVREAVETIIPTMYTKEGNKVEAQKLTRMSVSVPCVTSVSKNALQKALPSLST